MTHTCTFHVPSAGLQEDCPFVDAAGEHQRLDPATVASVDAGAFEDYASRLYAYLQQLENRLYSEGTWLPCARTMYFVCNTVSINIIILA